MENLDITLDKILEEYNKYLISRLINKEYDLNKLREMVYDFSKKSDLIQYNENDSNYEMLKKIKDVQLMYENNNDNKFKI